MAVLGLPSKITEAVSMERRLKRQEVSLRRLELDMYTRLLGGALFVTWVGLAELMNA